MKAKEKPSAGLLTGICLALLVVGIQMLYIKGPLGALTLCPETMWMAAQLLLLATCFLVFYKRVWLIAGFCLVFLWLHQVLVPILVSGGYVLFLILLGRCLCKWGLGDSYLKKPLSVRVLLGFFTGCLLFLILVCLLSLMGQGSIRQLRLITVAGATVLFGGGLFSVIRQGGLKLPVSVSAGDGKQRWLLALILMMVLLQAGRMNIALDYDSLHYGFRSQYVLNGGKGIYENLGQINVVYTYSKGLETLLLPLSALKSHSFLLGFQLWMAVGVLLLTGLLTEKLAGRGWGLFASALVSCIPGVMNLAISAKTDMITLLFQLMFLYVVVQYLEDREPSMLVVAGSLCLFTVTLKPTALVFSAVIFMVTLVYLIGKKAFALPGWNRWWCLAGLTAVAVAGILGRTLLLTGVPITSVFTSLFEGIGFQLKYPFSYSGIPGNGGNAFSAEGIRHILGRLWGFFVAPVGQDMDHVIIAWGGAFTLYLLCLLLLFRHRVKPGCQWATTYLRYILIGLLCVSIISIHKLWQVDGNYFMLLYVVLAVTATACMAAQPQGSVKTWQQLLLCPLICFQIAVTMVTNWAGVTGFSPLTLIHKGYYDHQKVARQELVELGNEAIYQTLAQDPTRRVLAVGEEPLVLGFPCNVQTYNDVSGSGGDVRLVKTLQDFKGFLSYANIQTFYVQAGFVKKGTRVYDILTYMIEDGSLTQVRTEHGNLLATVNVDGSLPVNQEENLEIWHRDYYLGE